MWPPQARAQRPRAGHDERWLCRRHREDTAGLRPGERRLTPRARSSIVATVVGPGELSPCRPVVACADADARFAVQAGTPAGHARQRVVRGLRLGQLVHGQTPTRPKAGLAAAAGLTEGPLGSNARAERPDSEPRSSACEAWAAELRCGDTWSDLPQTTPGPMPCSECVFLLVQRPCS